jgi:hypothetical protein
MTKPRIVYIHGDGVSNWRWGWVVPLQRDLQRAGFPTFFELFPDSIEARAEYWLSFPPGEFTELSRSLDARTFELPGAGHFAERPTFVELSDHIVQAYGSD